MKKLLGITLGIMTALGGFVDLGQIVFTLQAGALFRYQLMWAIVLGTGAIIVYMEMCGRIAVVAREPVFSVIRQRLGERLGFTVLIASNLLNLVTCAAETAGIAIVLRLLTGWPEKLLIIAVPAVLGVTVLLCKFEWIERTFGLGGLMMITFAVAAVVMRPNWKEAAHGLIPSIPEGGVNRILLYCFFAVGIFSAMLMEYEVHFYSSGALEEDWKIKELGENFLVSSFGCVLGAFLTASLLILGAQVFQPRCIFPEMLSTAVMAGSLPFFQKASVLVLLGVFACLGGAAIETALSGGYNLCQFLNLPWGKNRHAKDVPAYTVTWIMMFALAGGIAVTGVRPLQLVNVSVVFATIVMPFTYYPILRCASDREIMGKHVNSKSDTIMAMFFLVVIVATAVAIIPLTIMTNSGRP